MWFLILIDEHSQPVLKQSHDFKRVSMWTKGHQGFVQHLSYIVLWFTYPYTTPIPWTLGVLCYRYPSNCSCLYSNLFEVRNPTPLVVSYSQNLTEHLSKSQTNITTHLVNNCYSDFGLPFQSYSCTASISIGRSNYFHIKPSKLNIWCK